MSVNKINLTVKPFLRGKVFDNKINFGPFFDSLTRWVGFLVLVFPTSMNVIGCIDSCCQRSKR